MRAAPASSWRQPLPRGRSSVSPADGGEQEGDDLVAGGQQARREVNGRRAGAHQHRAERSEHVQPLLHLRRGRRRDRRGRARSRPRAARRAGASASAPRMRSGRPRSFSSAAREAGRRWAISTRVRSGITQEVGLSRRARLALAPGGQRDEHGAVLAVEAAAPLDLAPGGLGVGQQAGVRAVAALVLLGDPLGAAERLGAPRELVGQLEQVDHVAGRVLELRGRQRALAPVGVALALVELDAEHALQQVAQTLPGAQADEAGASAGRR